MPAFPCGLILTSLAWASPALAQEPAKLAVPTELPRLEVVDQVPFLLWGEHTVLRDLRFVSKGQTFPFDPARVRIEADGSGARFVPASAEDEGLVIRGTFALDYDPLILQSQLASPEAPVQFVIGRVASELCDLLATREGGLALHAPGCLDLNFWLEGGPAELRLKLRERPTLQLIPTPPTEDRALAGLRSGLRQAATETKRSLRPSIEELWFASLPDKLERRALAPTVVADLSQPRIFNLRVGALPDQAAFDVLMLHNPTAETRTMKVDYAALGWERPKRQRFVVLNEDGSSLGTLADGFELRVPPRGQTLVTLRTVMPRGMVASSAGPLAPMLEPWLWKSLTAAASGIVRFDSTWACRAHSGQAGWVVFSVADGRNNPYRVEKAELEQGSEVEVEQQGALVLLRLPASEPGTRSLLLKYVGRVDG
ncbi:MAG: hypothetical protein CMJ94_01815 [Planctomycetes bacterium]|nr:hypothetical protein [Planctomycetota bacterium]